MEDLLSAERMQTIPSRNPPNTQRGTTTPQHPCPSALAAVVPPSGSAARSSPGRDTDPAAASWGGRPYPLPSNFAGQGASGLLPLCHTAPGRHSNPGAAGQRPGQERSKKGRSPSPAACLLPECDPFSLVSPAVLKWDFFPASGDLTSAYIIGKALLREPWTAT